MESEEVDIFLIQEATTDLLEMLNKEKYHIIPSERGNSVIILRKSQFKKIHNLENIIANLP